MTQDRKEYLKAWKEAHRESVKAKKKAWREAHKESVKAKNKVYYEANKEEVKAKKKAWRESHREQYKAYMKAYKKADVNANGQTKHSIRVKSWHYLKKYGTKIPGYQIHHCCTYTEPYKFIYCSRAMHLLIHAYLRQHNIDADSNHYDYIKHLLDDTVVLYGLER